MAKPSPSHGPGAGELITSSKLLGRSLITAGFLVILLGVTMPSQQILSPADHNHVSFNLAKSVNVALDLKVMAPNGQTISNTYLPHDLILNNFYYAMLYPFCTNTNGCPKATDEGGAAVSLCYSGCTSAVSAAQEYIEIGSGTTSPSPSDFKLNTPVATLTPSAGITTYTTSPYQLTYSFSATWTTTTATTISESGVSESWYGTGANLILLFHDTFTGIAVPANGALTITYTFTVTDTSGVVNLNFLNWIVSTLNAPTSATGSQVSGTSNFAFSYVNTGGSSSTNPPAALNIQTSGGFLTQLGTSSTPPVPTQHSLGSSTGPQVAVSTPSISSGTLSATVSAPITLSSGATITEADLVVYDGTFMIFRVTFPGIAVPTSGTVTVVFTYQV